MKTLNRSILLSFAFLIVTFPSAAWAQRPAEIGDPWTLTRVLTTPYIWFTSEGHLVLAQRIPASDDQEISVTLWKNGPNEKDMERLGTFRLPGSSGFPAINQDASRVAFVDTSKRVLVVLGTTDRSIKYEAPLQQTKSKGKVSVGQFAFVGPGGKAVALLFADGDLQIFGLGTQGLERLDYTWIDFKKTTDSEPDLKMWGSTSVLFVASYSDGKLFRFPLQSDGNFQKTDSGEPVIQTTDELSNAIFAVNQDGTAIFSSARTSLSRWLVGDTQPTFLKPSRPDLKRITFRDGNDYFEIGDAIYYCSEAGDCQQMDLRKDQTIINGITNFAAYKNQIAFVADKYVYHSTLTLALTPANSATQGSDTSTSQPQAASWTDYVRQSTLLPYVLLAVVFLTLVLSRINLPVIRRVRDKLRSVIDKIFGDDSGGVGKGMKLPPLEVPEQLVQACLNGECVLFAGAGVSAESGYPVWKSFVQDLITWASENEYIDGQTAVAYRKETDEGNSNLIADNIYSRVEDTKNLDAMYLFLKEKFESPSRSSTFVGKHLSGKRGPNRTHELLKRIPFSAVLTTNFDQLLEETFDRRTLTYTYRNTDDVLKAITTRTFFLLKLYGRLEDRETLLVAPAQFEEAINQNRDFSKALETLFRSRTILFVGASLEGIETYLKTVSLSRGFRATHYALVNVTDEAWTAKADFLERRYGIRVLAFNTKGAFTEVNTFLEQLSDQVEFTDSTVDRPSTEIAHVQKIYLRNLGPFHEEEITFDARWNLLLGDNGVGKSTVLKAIAVALCGEKASAYAGRLVRLETGSSGPSTGSIKLTTSKGTSYITDVAVDPITEDCTIMSGTAHPMEAEGWLALGFPALRSLGWKRVDGPASEPLNKLRPVADDLIPMLSGDPDPRLDKLKQWIVTLDYERTRRELQRPESGAKYKRLIDRVFEFVNAMIAPTHVTYRGVDKNNRIQIETADGPIPLEAVSQGMASLIGWTGVLMQRMYEIYERDENPLERFALVLVDEIDAHMHPHWQQQLIPRLRDFFPKAQFIISTHSPLIVSGLSANEITRFVRNEEGRVEIRPIKPDMPFGYADQILTSDLFNLSTSLPVTTQDKVKRYEELSRKSRTVEEEFEYENLVGEIQFLVPTMAASYQEKHDGSVETAELMKTIGERINKLSPGDGTMMVARGEKLLSRLKGGENDPS